MLTQIKHPVFLGADLAIQRGLALALGEDVSLGTGASLSSSGSDLLIVDAIWLVSAASVTDAVMIRDYVNSSHLVAFVQLGEPDLTPSQVRDFMEKTGPWPTSMGFMAGTDPTGEKVVVVSVSVIQLEPWPGTPLADGAHYRAPTFAASLTQGTQYDYSHEDLAVREVFVNAINGLPAP